MSFSQLALMCATSHAPTHTVPSTISVKNTNYKVSHHAVFSILLLFPSFEVHICLLHLLNTPIFLNILLLLLLLLLLFPLLIISSCITPAFVKFWVVFFSFYIQVQHFHFSSSYSPILKILVSFRIQKSKV
jgi:hypothetical protein